MDDPNSPDVWNDNVDRGTVDVGEVHAAERLSAGTDGGTGPAPDGGQVGIGDGPLPTQPSQPKPPAR